MFVSAALASFAMAAVACSDDDDRKTFETGGVDSGTDARQPTPPAEAGPVESGTDAGNDFDAADEPVVCDVEPCAVDIAAGQNHFCVLMSDKTARCWGDDSLGQLGAGMPAPDPEPDAGPVRVVQGLTNVTQISAGGTTTCGRLVDGTVECWGGNDVGQLGLTADPPTSDWNPHPTAAAVAVSGALRVDVGVHSACAIVTSGDVLCWGANDQAQLARSVEATIGGPAKIDALSGKTVQTGAGTNTSFAVHQDGTISSWGATTGTSGTIAGRLASVSPDLLPGALLLDGVTSFAVSPWRVDSPWPAPDRGLAHACAVAEGRLYCWGDSMLGAMGFGVPFAFVRPTLVPIQGEARPQRAAVSMEISCVRMSDGTVQCAGDDSHGQLGRGADAGLFSDFFTPAKAFDGHALRVAVSDETVCVVVRGGKVMCWGGNAYGELALGSIDDSPHPTPTLVQF
ncbi:hypothetical protein AKJ09_01570 [Labilithrix luteola]|uniref:BNR repeat domain protein n=1 Tax=Labilithrix luteola TaxID=1391654 RepID=A0A0K1PND6_9BACT|nr:hypothetical protein AKJ09_01570 [Labilithrix luteola]